MADAVLTAINNLISGINAFYITLLLLIVAFVMFFLIVFRDEIWWKGIWITTSGVLFTIGVTFGRSKGIIPESFSLIGWLGYAFIIIGFVLTVVGLIADAFEASIR